MYSKSKNLYIRWKREDGREERRRGERRRGERKRGERKWGFYLLLFHLNV
jgi:hypothetical protein